MKWELGNCGVKVQGLGGWDLRPINCCTSPMILHKITPSVEYHLWLKRLDTQLNKPTNQNTLKGPKIDKQTIKKMFFFYKLWGLWEQSGHVIGTTRQLFFHIKSAINIWISYVKKISLALLEWVTCEEI